MGPEHRDTAISLDNLALVLQDLGDPAAAGDPCAARKGESGALLALRVVRTYQRICRSPRSPGRRESEMGR